MISQQPATLFIQLTDIDNQPSASGNKIIFKENKNILVV
jgi:hypothetical protein